jgi:hypothetical protein
VEGLVEELRRVVARLKDAASAPSPQPHAGAVMPAGGPPAGPGAIGSEGAGGVEMADALAAAAERLRTRAQEQLAEAPAPQPRAAPHKHSMSLITRWRLARRRRRER